MVRRSLGRSGTTLNNLAGLYESQGRYRDAELLYKRSLAIHEKALGPKHRGVATDLNNLAGLYASQGRYLDAEGLYKRSLAIRETALGLEHPDIGESLNNVAALYRDQGRYADAEALYKRSLGINEKVWGPEHPIVGTTLSNLAEVYVSQNRYLDAEPLYKRSLAIVEKALGPRHPNVAIILNNLSVLYLAKNRYGEALALTRKATAISIARIAQARGQRSTGNLSEQRGRSDAFIHHVSVLDTMGGDSAGQRERYLVEAFEVAQFAIVSNAASAVAGMAVRFAKGDGEVAKIARATQDALERWQYLDGELIKAAGKSPGERNAKHEERLRNELAGLDTRIAELDTTLLRTFPEYKELTSPEPLTLKEAQGLLAPQEALLTYLVGKKESFLLAARNNQAKFVRIDIGKEALDKVIKELRHQLDPSGGVLRPFAIKEAHDLYRRIFAPAEPLLRDATHIMVVPYGALQSLPFGVLVTEAPKSSVSNFSDNRDVTWLAKKYAVTVLPSVSSLRALRRFAKGAAGEQPFAGFGDPVLEGKGADDRKANVTTLFSRGAIADVNEVRQLHRLPETADELYAMAAALRADKQHIYLRQAATEANVKRLNLSRYRTLAFATHGLIAGEFRGLAEPALVLTPPKKGTETDDGLLTASEIAQLKLNAEWVILSACNTAAPDGTPGAEGLSGLARAFFYAGSRALLVSHWAVASDATVELTTRMFKEAAAYPGIGRSEALRRSMLALMNNQTKSVYAHPAFWAPFVIVGEGGEAAALRMGLEKGK